MNIVDQLLKVALLGSAWVLYLLIALSVFSISVMLERALFFRKNSRGSEDLRDDVLDAIKEGDEAKVESILRASTSVEGRAVATAYGFRDGGSDAISFALESELAIARGELERGLNFLGTIGNNGPFVGLLGTVIGVIDAFRALGSDGARSGAMGGVMSGIAEALVATGVGLFVALPAVVAYNILQKRIGDIEQEAISLGRLLTAWTEVRAKGGVIRDVDGPKVVATTSTTESRENVSSTVTARVAPSRE
jgi:biopolymer transport protein ExbB/TolQ